MKKMYLSIRTFYLLIGLILTSVSVKSQSIVASLEKSFSGITNIQVEGYYCNVEVIGSASASGVHFKGELYSSNHYYLNIHESVSGSTLKIWVDTPKGDPGNTKGQLTFTVPSRVKLDVENTIGNVLVQNMSGTAHKIVTTLGKTTVTNVNAGLNIQSVSGGVTINELRGNLDLTTRLGEHVIKNVTGDVNITNANGNIGINGVKGNVVAKTTRGRQGIQHITGMVDVESEEGDLTLNGITGNVNATSKSGDIVINQVTGVLKLNTVIGHQNGKGNRLTGDSSFTSSSGNINLQFLNTKEQLSFYLTTTSGKLNAKGRIGRRNLVVDNGGIRVTGKTSAGSQTYN